MIGAAIGVDGVSPPGPPPAIKPPFGSALATIKVLVLPRRTCWCSTMYFIATGAGSGLAIGAGAICAGGLALAAPAIGGWLMNPALAGTSLGGDPAAAALHGWGMLHASFLVFGIGGVIIGVGEKIGEFYWGPLLGSGIESWLAYVIALVFLLFRPQGLFGERIIERI